MRLAPLANQNVAAKPNNCILKKKKQTIKNTSDNWNELE